jgi:uncharacterized protein with FMN-binding domain
VNPEERATGNDGLIPGHQPAAPRAGGGSGTRFKNNLLALGSAAVLTVYAAGYVRTRPAAQRFAAEAAERRPAAATAETAAKPETAAAPPVTPRTAAAPHAAPASVRARDSTPAPTTASTASPAAAPPGDSSLARAAAQAADSAAQAAEKAALWKDGTYSGWGTSRHGDIEASVEIRDGRIVSASISQCLTRYSCSWISMLPPQVVTRQSPETDYVSGATQSTNAFYYAVVEALSKAK